MIYIKKIHRGDDGYTDVAMGRVPKDSPVVELMGDIDELISTLGIVRSILSGCTSMSEIVSTIRNIQVVLMMMASHVAGKINEEVVKCEVHVKELEKEIEKISNFVGHVDRFVIPGTSFESSLIHFARTVCRRAERRAVVLMRSNMIARHCFIYLNRLSDLLYLYALYVDIAKGVNIDHLQAPNR